jgi:hypothetical protein
MKADFTRDSFRPEQHYARVIHPQGHVTLDAELNEQSEIQLYRDRQTAIDVIGADGTPNGTGFQLAAAPNQIDLLILPGHYYVDGRLVEASGTAVPVSSFPSATVVQLAALTLDGRPLAAGQWLEIAAPGATTHRFQIASVDAANRRVTLGAGDVGPPPDVSPIGLPGATLRRIPSYLFQPDWPRPAGTTWPAAPALPALALAAGTYGAYLEVFAHHVIDLADPLLREVALGGIDGASREQTAWQVRLRSIGPVGTPATCAQVLPPAIARGALKARARQPATGTNPCIIDPTAQYRRLENQLYRVEVHQGGRLGIDPDLSFKFSRDNGSVVVRWTASTASTVTVASIGRDATRSLAAGDWIELTDDQHELARLPGTLVQIDTVQGTTLNLKPGTATGSTAIGDFAFNPRVRRWDQIGAAALALVRPATNDGYVALEDGVEVRFEDGAYDTGDYWLLPARTITADVEWPRDLDGLAIAEPSRTGVPERVALGVVEWTGTQLRVLADCREQFPPLTHICAKDVCLDNDPCNRGWKNVQQAIDELCHEDDLVFHNQHLHGWGVVCGLQVRCMTDDYATAHKLQRPREYITVRDGYAIHPTGSDLIVQSAAKDQITAIELGDLAVAQGLVKRTPAGAIPDASMSLWIDKDGSFKLDAYDPNKVPGWKDRLDGTILLDIYNDCVLKVIDFFKSQVTPGAAEGLVGSTAERIIALTNLLWQLINPTSGRHIYLSGEPNPTTEPADKEDAILRAFFNGLKALLQSKSFCAMFDDVQYPAYNVYRAGLVATAPHPTTIYGTGRHTRIRVHPRRALAFTCGNGSKIHVYDLAAQKIVAAVEFPISGAEVQDVAFGITGNDLYAIAWIGDQQVDSVFVVGTINTDGTITWTQNQVQCHLKLITLAISDAAPGVVYAAARGLGIYPFNPGALTPTPTPIKTFFATGHLVSARRGDFALLYAGAHTSNTNPVAFDQVLGINVKTPAATLKFALPPDETAPGIGHDDIAVALSTKNGVDSIYAVIDGPNQTKRMAVWNGADTAAGSPAGAQAQRVIPLGPSWASRVAYSAAGNWSMVTYEDSYEGRAFRPTATALETGIHPLQIGPVSIATDATGQWFYVLEWVSNTITAIPAVADPASPWLSTIDRAALEAYRTAVIAAFLKALGRFAQYLKDCICDHLLVECPDPAGKKVYLADVSFKNGSVYQICNFHHRRYVHTFPTVEYWMSFVPVLPMLKAAVEKACCSVLAGVFDKFAPPVDAAAATPDKVSVASARNGLTYVRDFHPNAQYQAQKSQLSTTVQLGRLALASATRQPSPGKVASPVGAVDVVNKSSADATRAAQAKGLAVRNVTPSTSAIGALLRSAFAAPTVNAGDTVDLMTDPQGNVIGMTRASGAAAPPPPPAATASAPPAGTATMADVAALRDQLKQMQDLHAQQTATITALQGQVTQMNASLLALKK